MKQIELAAIAVDASTQIRISLNDVVVKEYAERMLDGVRFPPIVLFHDGTNYHIGDGFHRVLAAQQNGAVTVDADVRNGTHEDALWFALGANREHGRQLTPADRRHAIKIALQTEWSESKTAEAIAQQLGISHQRVSEVRVALALMDVQSSKSGTSTITRKNGRSYPATHRAATAAAVVEHNAVAAMVQQGATTQVIETTLGARREVVAAVRRELGVPTRNKSRKAVAARVATMQRMATEGYTSRQIAAEVGMTLESARQRLRIADIEVPADKVLGKQQRHDANRIVDHMVEDAENLTADVNLIDFTELDTTRLCAWVDSLKRSRERLTHFITRLSKEVQTHEVA